MYKDWLREGLRQRSKTGKGLARALGVDDSVVSRMVRGRRPIKADELPTIAEYLGLPIPSCPSDSEISVAAGQRLKQSAPQGLLVPVRTKLASGAWRDDDGSISYSLTMVPSVVHPRLKGIEQYACEFEGMPGRFGIFVPYYSYRIRPLNGDSVHVRRTCGSLREDSLRIVSVQYGDVNLVAADDQDNVVKQSLDNPENVIEICGLMVGRYEILSFM